MTLFFKNIQRRAAVESQAKKKDIDGTLYDLDLKHNSQL